MCLASLQTLHSNSVSAILKVQQAVSKPRFYKSQETAPNACQRISTPQWKKLAKSRLQFLSASFYVPDGYCSLQIH